MTGNRVALSLGVLNLALVGVLAAQSANGAPDAAPVVRAQLIELVDSKGGMRAQFKTEDDGTVVLRLRDQSGRVRVKLAAEDLGSALLLADDTTEVGVHLLSGVSRLTQKPGTSITVAVPGGAKTVITPAGVK